MSHLPSIRTRLANALLSWSLVWGLAVSAAVWLTVRLEVEELLDDTLQASAELLGAQLVANGAAAPAAGAGTADARFAWQLVGPGARLLQRSAAAPTSAWRATPGAGFSDTADWRLFGTALGSDGRMLYVAQTRAERGEAQAEVALFAALAALAVGLLGQVWLRSRVGHELRPLEALSARLAGHEPLAPGATLGPAERRELQPVHTAIDALAERLARRVASERAFAAHAAHALRTPLAGLDAQLAVAQREGPPALQPRLQRAREAAGRLQRVVAALLALFRSGSELQRSTVSLPALLERLPIEGLEVEVAAGAAALRADADLLTAALLNLLDNALRHGARRVTVSTPAPDAVRLHDDGPGVTGERRAALQDAIDRQAYEGQTGLGLQLADLVARSHGGRLVLPAVASGFAVELRLAGVTA